MTTQMLPTAIDRYVMLCNNQYERLETYNKYKDFIHDLDNGKKQKRYRKMLKNILIYISHAKTDDETLTRDYTLEDLTECKVKPIFATEEDEYRVINKFGRGMWDEHSIRSGFNLAEQDIIVEIAKGYGAFYY
jgi:hypothetical protein